MASAYLVGVDLAAFGVPSATSAQVQSASGIVDGFLQRPAGCAYDPVALQMFNTGEPIIEAPGGRQRIVLSYTPVTNIISIDWRQAGVWQTVPWTYDFDADGLIHVDGYGFEYGYSRAVQRPVQVTYIAGWTYAALPFAIKQATANILMAQQQIPTTAFSDMKAGDTQFKRASTSLLDADTKAMLSPYQRMFAW